MDDTDDRPQFEQVDWTAIDTGTRWRTPERLALGIGLTLVAALYGYDTYVGGHFLIGRWHVSLLDWLFMCSAVVLVAYGLVPAIRRPQLLARTRSKLRGRPVTLAAGLYLVGFLLVALLGPVVLPRPDLRFGIALQPPVGFSTTAYDLGCVGTLTGELLERRCHGTWTYPLGTDPRGIGISALTVFGARVALYIVVIASALIVPLAAGVGTIAGLRGGRLDDLLMSYVDVQLSIPAIVLYFIGVIYWGPSLLLLLATFGLLSWGGLARLVRSEALQRREDGHVLVARSLGASDSYLARRHVLPNITNTLVPAVFHLLALLVLVEVGVAFLGFKDVDTYSWGLTISEGLFRGGFAYEVWWVSTFPALALTATLLSFKLLGDGLRDVLDPRQGGG